jgi:hypothetical protein
VQIAVKLADKMASPLIVALPEAVRSPLEVPVTVAFTIVNLSMAAPNPAQIPALEARGLVDVAVDNYQRLDLRGFAGANAGDS